jgi:hypothetical protein
MNNVNGVQYPNGGLMMLISDGNEIFVKKIDLSSVYTNKSIWSLGIVNDRLFALSPNGLTYFDLQSDDNNPVQLQGPVGLNGAPFAYFPQVSFGGPDPGAKIKIDPQNNIWVGSSNQGVYVLLDNLLFWPDAGGIRESNTPLLSDLVLDIAFDTEIGVAYITTNKGINTLVIPDDMLNIEDSQPVMLPGDYSLKQNYPNPFNPLTTIQYSLPIKSHVSLVLYDILGRQVRTLVNSYQDIGNRSVRWDSKNEFGKHVSAGVYLYQIHAGEFVQTKKMVLLK